MITWDFFVERLCLLFTVLVFIFPGVFFWYRHCIEFLIGEHPLPYNMTIFQAVKQYALVSIIAENTL